KASTILIVVVAALALSVAAGFGAAQATRTDSASASSKVVASQLKQINQKLGTLTGQLGATYKSKSALGLLSSINGSTTAMKDGIGTSDLSFGTVRGLLKRICEAQGATFC